MSLNQFRNNRGDPFSAPR